MSNRDDGTGFRAHRKAWMSAWAIFLSIVFAFGWYKSSENAREEQALRTWEVEQAELSKKGEIEWNRFIAEFDSLSGKPGSQKALEDKLNAGAPFELHPLIGSNGQKTETRQEFKWTDPKYGGDYSFEFENGVLVGRGAHWGGVPETLHPRPTLTYRTNSAERLRQHIARFAFNIWLIAIACWVVLKRWRLVSAQVALAAALASGMAWLVNPFYSITWQGVFSNDNLFFAAVMLALSAALLGVTAAKAPSTTELRFRLAELFFVITVAAILFAIGPFGYVTFFAATGVSVVLVASFFLCRDRGLSTS